jgi:molybdopterin converting factor small subunit
MKVIFFAQSRQAAGCAETELELEGPIDAAELWDRLVKVFSGLAPLRGSARLARGETYLAPDARLQPDDEIAVIPAVSGG